MPIFKTAKVFVQDFINQIQRKIAPEENQIAKQFFEERKKEVLNQIKDHVVSRELRSHVSPSSLLTGTRGSFFGFLGLKAGSKPVDTILDITSREMSYKIKKKILKRGMTVDIYFPTVDDYRVSELILPWEGGGSLVEGVEKGVSGLNYYIKTIRSKKTRSRSREGIQVHSPISVSQFGGVPYLSAIFKKADEEAKAFRF